MWFVPLFFDFFFFSSRRRHTRWPRDWSSDVCSSDLTRGGNVLAWDNNETRGTLGWRGIPSDHNRTAVDLLQNIDLLRAPERSEERRVGKECRKRWEALL